MPLAASVAMTALGKKGVKEMADCEHSKSKLCEKSISKKMDLMLYLKVQSFNEFVVKLNKPVKEINQKLLTSNILVAMI